MSTGAMAAPEWRPDLSFGGAGAATLEIDPGPGDRDVARIVLVDGQHRLYTVGTSSNDNGSCLALARFLVDGAPDPDFHDGNKMCLSSLFDGASLLAPTDALLQADGKLVVAGYDVTAQWPVICRFDADGELDVTRFGSSSTPGCVLIEDVQVKTGYPFGTPDEVGSDYVSIASDGDTLRVALTVDSGMGSAAIHIARTTSDGKLAPFGQVATMPVFTGVNHYLSETFMTKDGMLALAGTIDQNVWDMFVAVVDPDTGEFDPTFNGGKMVTFTSENGGYDVPTAVALTREGNIIVGGASGKLGNDMRPSVTMLDRSGTPVPSFNSGALAVLNPCVFYIGKCSLYVTDMDVLSEGTVLLAGYGVYDGFHHAYTMRLLADGTPDPSYGPGILGQQGFALLPYAGEQIVSSLAMQDGQTVLAGWRDMGEPNGYDMLLMRLGDGSLFRDGFEQP